MMLDNPNIPFCMFTPIHIIKNANEEAIKWGEKMFYIVYTGSGKYYSFGRLSSMKTIAYQIDGIIRSFPTRY